MGIRYIHFCYRFFYVMNMYMYDIMYSVSCTSGTVDSRWCENSKTFIGKLNFIFILSFLSQ